MQVGEFELTGNEWALSPAASQSQAVVGQFLATFRDYPPCQKAASFTIQQILDKMNQPRAD
jgi:hypothetical protein